MYVKINGFKEFDNNLCQNMTSKIFKKKGLIQSLNIQE